MPADVVNRHQRHVQRQRRSLGKIHADQQSADQAGRIGHSDGVDVRPRHVGAQKRLIRKAINRLNVLARGDLRNNAAVDAMQRDLRGDAVRQYLPAVAYQRDGGFVAGGFHR